MTQWLKRLYIGMVFCFLYAPIVVLIVYSFNNAAFSATWHGATWKWYRMIFQDGELLGITRNSLLVATVAATIASVIGAIGATALFRYHFRGRYLLSSAIFILIIVPDLVLGTALLVLFAICKISLGFWTLLIAHITFCLPFVLVVIYARLKDLDKHIIEAAQDLGASEYFIFLRVILPLILPALMAGWLLSFTLSMDDVIISFFVSGGGFQILPLYIYSLVRVGVTPEINALCTLIFIFTGALALIVYGCIGRKQYAKSE